MKISKPFKFIKTVKGTKYSRFRVKITFPFDDELGFKPKSIPFEAPTAVEALAKARAWTPAKSEQLGKMSFLAYVKDVFLPTEEERTEKATSLKRKIGYDTFKARKARLTNYFLEPENEELAKCSIRKVNIASLKKPLFVAYFAAIRSRDVAPETQRKLMNDISKALSNIEEYLPTSKAVLRRAMEVDVGEKQERLLFKAESIFAAIINENAPLEYRCILACQCFLRCRPNELWGLLWSAVDVDEEPMIQFHSAMRQGKRGMRLSKGSKTGEKGSRDIPLMGTLLKLLKELKAEKNGQPEEFVFTYNGKPLDSPKFSHKVWVPLKQAFGLPDGPQFYSLKHLMFSYSRAEGLPEEVNSMLAGHSIFGTKAHYRKLLKRDVEQAYEIFEDGLSRAKAKQSKGGKNEQNLPIAA